MLLFLQEEFPVFQNSYLKVWSDGLSNTAPRVLINDIEFYYSKWEFYSIDINMTNCNTLSLYLNVDWCNSISYMTSVNIDNCTLGCWTFKCISDVQITDCGIEENPVFCSSKRIMDFHYSTAILENIMIQNVQFDYLEFEYYGLIFDLFSKVIIRNLFYERNVNTSVLVANGSSLMIENCTFSDNNVFNGVIFGGGSMDVNITNSTFENNIRSKGGSVCMTVSAFVFVNGCTFTGNQGLGLGGGVMIREDSTLVISNSIFIKNTAGIAGGGVYVYEYSRLDISKSTFDGNTARFRGGAVCIGENSSAICSSSSFVNNKVTKYGGAIAILSSSATLSNMVITENQGLGAVSFSNSHVANIYSCTFNKNTNGAIFVLSTSKTAVSNTDFFYNHADMGAAIYTQFSESVTVSNVRFIQNVARTGGAIGMIYSKIFIDSCILEDNAAFFDGGAIFTPSGNISVENSYFRNNTAEKGFGGIVSIGLGRLFMLNCSVKHSHVATAGAIQGNECYINLTHCIFENNTAATNGGAIYIRDNAPPDGWASSRRGSTLHVIDSFFSGNNALTGIGGAIYIFGKVIKILNTTFSFNKGAGIMELLNVEEILLNGCVFADNFLPTTGIINVTDSTFVAINSVFNKNKVAELGDGGCLVLTNGRASLENCTLSGNIHFGFFDKGRGGAITSSQCELRISACIFDSNKAGLGKDIFLDNDLLIYQSSFKHAVTYRSNDENFKHNVFQENIFFSSHPNDITVTESQYASGKNSLWLIF